jgi:putative ABC transport system substrate-binding protein
LYEPPGDVAPQGRGEQRDHQPVEVPMKFQFLINLKTAKALELTLPESLLLRADEAIE